MIFNFGFENNAYVAGIPSYWLFQVAMVEGYEQIVEEVELDDVTLHDDDVTVDDDITVDNDVTVDDDVTAGNDVTAPLCPSAGVENGNSVSHDYELQMEEVHSL